MIDISENINKTPTTVEGKKDHFLAAWYAVKQVIKEEIPEPSDVGFLMETLSDIAEKVKDTNKTQKVTLPLNKWIGIWHCINVCIRNKMYTSQGQELMMHQILSFSAVEIDKVITLNSAPNLDQSSTAYVDYDESPLKIASEMAENGELAPVVKRTKEGFGIIDGGKK